MKKLILATICVGFAFGAHAATYCYWVGPNGGEWSNAANWKNGRIPAAAGDVARLSTTEAPDCGTLIALDNPEALTIDRIEALAGEWTIQLGGTLTFTNANVKTQTIDVEGDSKLTLVGGKIVGACYRVASGLGGGANQLVFRNTVIEKAYTFTRSGTEADSPDTFTINGGICGFRTWYPRLYDHMVVNSGLVTFGSIHGYDRYGEGKDIRREVALTVLGGKVVVDGVDQDMISGSVGILAASNGVVDIQVGGNQIWLANDKRVKCTWRVEDKALFQAAGPYVVNGTATGNVEVVGGRFVMKSSFANVAGSSAGRYSTFLLDGGILDFDYSDNGRLPGTVLGTGTEHKLVVGAKGAVIRNRNNYEVEITGAGIIPLDGVVDGGVVYKGCGKTKVGAGSYAGGTTVRGFVEPVATDVSFGAGDLTLASGGILNVALVGQTLPALTVSGGGRIDLASGKDVTVSSLTVEDGGLLAVDSAAAPADFGKTDSDFIALSTAPEQDALGLPVGPVIAITTVLNQSPNEAHLLTYDAGSRKLYKPAYKNYAACGGAVTVNDIVEVDATIATAVDFTAGALVLQGVSFVYGYKTITVGNGSGNAYAIFNSKGSSAGLTNAYLDFGAARGYLITGSGIKDVSTSCPGLNCYIKGSNGVVFFCRNDGGFKIYRDQKNYYSGGTRILGGEIQLNSSGASYIGGFGSGDVEVLGGERTGGAVRFQYARTHTQDFKISGFGANISDKTGALYFEQDVTLSGQVSLLDDAMITAKDGFTGTFSKAIKGTGDLYLGGAGTIAVPGVDIAGDLHVTGNVTSDGAILTGERFLFLDGTLTLNNTADITIDAKVLGNGTLVLAGTGKVNISDLSVFEGTIDLAGHPAALNAFSGVAKIVNSGDVKVDLTVSGSTPYAYFGEIGADIDLMLPGQLLFGYGATIPATAALTLDGGTIGLGAATTLAALSGDGTVSGQKLTVTGAVTPTEFDPGEVVLSFGRVPEFQTALDGKWRLKTVGLGAELAKRRGMMLIVR